MPVTEEQFEEFRKLADPIVKWLNENFNPHVTVIIDPTHAELLSGEVSMPILEHIKD